MFHVSCVTCDTSLFILFYFLWGEADNVVKLVGGGSVINGAYPVYFILVIITYMANYKKYC